MFSSTSKKDQTPDVMEAGEPVIGRAFILGLPDKSGRFHIFLDDQLWNIEPGGYQAGDRVHVMAIDKDMMTVKKSARSA